MLYVVMVSSKHWLRLLWAASVITSTFGRTLSTGGCSISLPTDIPRNEPVYLTQYKRQFRLYKPLNQSNVIPTNSKLYLYCPGKNNQLRGTLENTTELKCRGDSNFAIDQSVFQLSDMNCTKRVQNEYRVTSMSCGNNYGYIREIGFRISGNFLPVFKICYSNVTRTTLYSNHFINGAAIKYNVKENKRRGFHGTEGIRTSDMDRIYTQQSQIEHFNAIFGTQNYIDSSSYLDKGHLTPDADFVFTTAQFCTYYYKNTAPEFKVINRGNWKRVENMARGLAAKYKTDLLIYTGTYDILELPNSSGQKIPMYLDNSIKIPVPKWFWKIIKSNELNSAIVIITLNNPFAGRNDINEFCPNVCEKANLNSDNFQQIEKGYTFCCKLDDFKKVVNYIPNTLTAENLLNCSDLEC